MTRIHDISGPFKERMKRWKDRAEHLLKHEFQHEENFRLHTHEDADDDLIIYTIRGFANHETKSLFGLRSTKGTTPIFTVVLTGDRKHLRAQITIDPIDKDIRGRAVPILKEIAEDDGLTYS